MRFKYANEKACTIFPKLILITIKLDVVDAGFIELGLSMEKYMKRMDNSIVWSGLTASIKIPQLSRPTPDAHNPMKM